MQEELLQFKLQQVWILVDLPNGKKAIGTKWVFRNKKDERGIVIRNKANKVHKVVKALYRLHQAPRAWYETLANYLLSNGFKRGKIDQTLFIKKQKGDILLVQVYVDDIIFGSTNKELCTGFEKLRKISFNGAMENKLSSMITSYNKGRWNFYQSGIILYMKFLKKFNYTDVKFQVTPKTSHLLAVKRIFRYLKGKPTLGLWYSRDSPFELVAYTDSDYVEQLKIGSLQLEYCPGVLGGDTDNGSTYSLNKGPGVLGGDTCNMSTHKKIFVNPFHTKKVFANMKRAGKDFSGRITPLFDTMMVQPIEEMGEDSNHQTDSTPIHIIDQPSSSSQPKKKQPSKKAQRQEVLDLQKAKDAQAKDIVALKKRIQKLKKEENVKTYSLGVPEDASKQRRSIKDIDADVDVSLVDETQERQDDDLIFDSGILEDDVMHVEAQVDGKDDQSKKPDDSTAGEAVTTGSIDDSAIPTTNEEITLAQTLIQIKAAKPKVVTTTATTTTSRPKDKGVVVKDPSEFRVLQETQSSSS
ncbi:uncharacterized mitochondrial protein-like protein, partial [Tanacetum coccineum]